MISRPQLYRALLAVAGVMALTITGCPSWSWTDFGFHRPRAAPLGTLSDPVWQNQEHNAERSDFVVHEHEFVGSSEFLNTLGEDHLKQIAARLAAGQDAQVLVERCRNYARPETEYKYPVHPNPDLDVRRREIVVRSLLAMRIGDADARVVIAPDLAPNYRATDSPAVYYEPDNNQRGFSNGVSGFGGGFGGGY